MTERETRLQGLKAQPAAVDSEDADDVRAAIEALEARIEGLTEFRSGRFLRDGDESRAVQLRVTSAGRRRLSPSSRSVRGCRRSRQLVLTVDWALVIPDQFIALAMDLVSVRPVRTCGAGVFATGDFFDDRGGTVAVVNVGDGLALGNFNFLGSDVVAILEYLLDPGLD